MKKRILITSTDLMMIQFLVPHVINLVENGYEVEIACSDVGGRMDEVKEVLTPFVEYLHLVRLHRSPVNPENLKGYKDMKALIDKGHYDIIWTNEPVMGVVTRMAARAARKNGCKVLYMVHGFHFFKGAPKPYWLAFYPVERLMLHHTDTICTVNKEDYRRAKRMGAKDVSYIHGIGINTTRLTPGAKHNDIRQELGLKPDDFLVLSIGELNENKNQKTIIRALSLLKNPSIHYILCGKGDQRKALEMMTKQMELESQVHFLGYRTDVVDICSQSNIYVMPSHREGLPVSSLEAMYCGLPVVASNIRGLVDVIEHGHNGFLCAPDDYESFAVAIRKLYAQEEIRLNMGRVSKKRVKPYCIENVKPEVLELLESLYE